jgi:hypothetical protein
MTSMLGRIPDALTDFSSVKRAVAYFVVIAFDVRSTDVACRVPLMS